MGIHQVMNKSYLSSPSIWKQDTPETRRLRALTIVKIRHLLHDKELPTNPTTQELQAYTTHNARIHTLAVKIERKLYIMHTTKEEYINKATFEQRVRNICRLLLTQASQTRQNMRTN